MVGLFLYYGFWFKLYIRSGSPDGMAAMSSFSSCFSSFFFADCFSSFTQMSFCLFDGDVLIISRRVFQFLTFSSFSFFFQLHYLKLKEKKFPKERETCEKFTTFSSLCYCYGLTVLDSFLFFIFLKCLLL